MKHLKQKHTIGMGLRGVKFDVLVKRAKTGKVEKVSEGHNLILDSGLDLWGTNNSAELTQYCRVGDNTDPVERDSSTTTFSRSGTTVTASAGFFEAGDVGRLLKWDSGEEAYIASFTSTTEVETVDSGAIAADEGTIYYVDETALGNQLKSTNTCRTDTGDNQSSESAGVITHKRTHLFTAEVAPVTYQEVGWSTTSGGNLFNRALISGGVSLGIGDQLLIISNLEIVQSPQTTQTQSDIGTGGFDTSGDYQICGYGLYSVSSTGGTSSSTSNFALGTSGQLEPGETTGHIIGSTNKPAMPSYGTPIKPNRTYFHNVSNGGYSNGNYYRDKFVNLTTAEWVTSSGNEIDIIGLGRQDFDGSMAFPIRLDTPQEKSSSQTLEIRFRISWGRILTNS